MALLLLLLRGMGAWMPIASAAACSLLAAVRVVRCCRSHWRCLLLPFLLRCACLRGQESDAPPNCSERSALLQATVSERDQATAK